MADDTIKVRLILDDAGQAKKIQKKFEGVGTKIGKTLRKDVTSGLGNLAGVLAAALGVRKLIQTFTGFETALAEIRTITQGLGIDNAKLEKQLVAVSAQFGTSAQAQANSFYQIISAGVTDASRANDLLIASNKLAIGGLTSNAQAIDILTSAVNSFGQENLTGTRAADILFATVKLGKTRVDELASSLGQILPTAAALGISFEDTNAAIAQLTTRGVSTSEAVTQLNAVFTAVLKKQETAKKIGPQVAKAFTLQALQAKGLTGFLKDLNVAIGGSETQLVKLLGRAEGARAIITLAADGFEGLKNKTEALTNSQGAANEAFKIIDQTISQQVNKSLSTLSAIFLTITSESGSGFNEVLGFINSQLQGLFSTLRMFDGVGGIINTVLLNLQDGFADLALSAIESFSSIPFIGDKIKEGFASTVASLKATKDEIAQEIFEIIAQPDLPKDPETGRTLNPLGDLNKDAKEAMIVVPEALAIVKEGFADVFGFLNDGGKLTAENLTKLAASASNNLRKIGATFARGFAGSFAAVGAALVRGENAFQAFGKAILGVLGDIAIQAGTEIFLIGIGFSDPSKVATGLALIGLGGAIKALAGGGGGAATPSVAGGAPTAEAEFEGGGFDEAELAEPTTVVNVSIDGVVSDPRGVAQQLNDLLNEFSDTNGAVIVNEA